MYKNRHWAGFGLHYSLLSPALGITLVCIVKFGCCNIYVPGQGKEHGQNLEKYACV